MVFCKAATGQRIHRAASRIAMPAEETPASFVAFDLLAWDGQDLRSSPQSQRRDKLEQILAGAHKALILSPGDCANKKLHRGRVTNWLRRGCAAKRWHNRCTAA